MADRYYSNTDEGQRFQPGTTVRAGQVDGKLDEVTAGFQEVAQDVDRGIKLPSEQGVSQELAANALQRRNRVVGFDADGKLTLVRGFSWRGDWATATEYFVNDVFRDAASKNLYVVNVRHTSSALAADITAGRVGLAIEVAEIEQMRDQVQANREHVDGQRQAIDSTAQQVSKDAQQTASDRVQTGLDRTQTGEDRVQTGLDRTQTGEDRASASISAQAASGSKAKAQAWAEAEGEVEPGKRSARHWADQAAGIVADGVIDDSRTVSNLTWSSAKIAQELQNQNTRAITQALTVPPAAPDIGPWRIDASAVSRHVNGSVAAFEVAWWDGVTETVAAGSGSATLSRFVDQPVGGMVSATIRALDDIGNASAAETVTAEVVANNPPVGPIAIDAPTQVAKNKVFHVSFSGASDPDGDPLTYTVTDPGSFSFGKASNIAAGEIVGVTAPDVNNDANVTFSVVAEDAFGVQSATYSATVTVLAAQVIGVALRATGGPGGTWEHIDDAGNPIPTPSASWFNGHPVWGGMQDVLVDGQHMVEVPKFYYKRGTAGGSPAWWISDQPLSGFTVMPAFVLDGVEVVAFQYGKYQASMDGSKLASVPGVLPAVSRTLTQFLADAQARNVGGVAGFRLHHYDMWLAIQWLYLIEHATMDSQVATGQGRVSASSAAAVDASDVAQATYRGIVGLWGNVWQWMDGVRTLNSVIQRRSYSGSWVSTGESVPNGGNTQYPITFRATGDEQWIASTYSTSNNNTATLPDLRRWRDSGEYYPCVGGGWSNGANAGLWCVFCNNAASYASTDVGSRLARIVS